MRYLKNKRLSLLNGWVLLSAVLHVPKLSKNALFGKQLIVGSPLGNLAVGKDDDLRGVADGRESVRNNDCRSIVA